MIWKKGIKQMMLKKCIALIFAAAVLTAASANAEELIISDISDSYIFMREVKTDSKSVGVTVIRNGSEWENIPAEGLSGKDIAYFDEFYSQSGVCGISVLINCESGVYKVTAGDENGETLADILLVYSGKTENENAVKAVKEASKTSKEETLDALKKYKYALQLYMPISDNINEEKVLGSLYDYVVSDSEADGNKLARTYRRGVIIEALNENKIGNIDEYYKYLDIEDKKINNWYNNFDNQEKKTITERLSGKQISGFDDFTNKLVEAMVLQKVKKPNGYTNIISILNDFSDKTGIPSNIVTNKSSSAVAGRSFEDYDSLKNALKTAADTSNNRNYGGGGSGTSSSGGIKSSPFGNTSFGGADKTDSALKPLTSRHFKDLNGYEWADSAIEELYQKGIISGRRGDIFAPADNVTREEFAKMAVLALDLQNNSGTVHFDDVQDDAWYASYIFSLVNSGAANGIDDNLFGVGAPITRQDMSVIIYRGIKNKQQTDAKANFTDTEEAADYAREAIDYMSFKNYINGYEDGSFKPANNITRAEAAVILYRVIAAQNE